VCVCVDMDWFHLAHDRFQWRPLTDTEIGLSCTVKGAEFLDHLGDYKLLKKDYVC
jgi:hypothetical protein